jgi:hypothetical protein
MTASKRRGERECDGDSVCYGTKGSVTGMTLKLKEQMERVGFKRGVPEMALPLQDDSGPKQSCLSY